MATEITSLLHRIGAGDHEALHAVIPLVYDELKKLASRHLRREARAVPIETTALVHEAFLRLNGARHPDYENRSHFYGIASRLMRQILVDLARTRDAEKRKCAGEVRLTDLPDVSLQPNIYLLYLDQALDRLGQTHPLKVQLLEMRYFGGMTAEESATALAISVNVVRHELRLAQAWLRQEMSGIPASQGIEGLDEARSRTPLSRVS